MSSLYGKNKRKPSTHNDNEHLTVFGVSVWTIIWPCTPSDDPQKQALCLPGCRRPFFRFLMHPQLLRISKFPNQILVHTNPRNYFGLNNFATNTHYDLLVTNYQAVLATNRQRSILRPSQNEPSATLLRFFLIWIDLWVSNVTISAGQGKGKGAFAFVFVFICVYRCTDTMHTGINLFSQKSTLVLQRSKINTSYSYALGPNFAAQLALQHSWFCNAIGFATQLVLQGKGFCDSTNWNPFGKSW